jgi:DNA segregation ATPase FtsK/SpoIIIE-like protein
MALGIYFNRTGPFGRLVQWVTGSLLGQGKALVPLVFLFVGWVLIRGRQHEEPIPVVIGSSFLLAATTGLLHLKHDSLPWGTSVSRLRHGGGLLGMLMAEPLERFVATWGTVLVLCVLMLMGWLILLRLRVRDAYERTAEGVGSVASRGVRSLLILPSEDEDYEYDDDEVEQVQKTSRKRPVLQLPDPNGDEVERAAAPRRSRPQRRWLALLLARPAQRTAAPPIRSHRDSGAYDLPVYDDIDHLDFGVDESLGETNIDSDDAHTSPAKSKRRRGRKVVDGDAKGWIGEDEADADDIEHIDELLEEVAPAKPRKRARFNTVPEPVWAEDQPGAESVPLPGMGESPIVWKLPPRSLLKKGKTVEIDKKLVEAGGRTLEEALAAHGVETRLVGMTVGPTVTRYELELAPGVKVAKVTALSRDIAYAMATADVRILAPIPGKSAIGVEVPNQQRQLVAVGDVLNTQVARDLTSPLSVAVGRDIDGKPVMVDLAKMPHVLVAGTTGSGKSSCINSLLASILMRTTPDEVRLILIDPKMVELSQYNGLPHLLTQVVTNPKKAANALQWAVDEMEKRYEMLARLGFRDILGYNAAVVSGALDDPYADDPAHGMGMPPQAAPSKLSYILVVVDELADLMMVAARDVEESICRIAQKARAVGIHLVIATQRPSVNVITGLIKANVPSRFAFAVSSLTDSRVIIDQPGAERLIGQGDMLMMTVSSNVAQRVQGNFVSEDEVRGIVNFWKKQSKAVSAKQEAVLDDPSNDVGTREATSGFVDFTSDGGVERIESPTPRMIGGTQGAFAYGGLPELAGASAAAGSLLGGDSDDDSDDMLDQAMELIVRSQLGSTSMLQRKLRVGFSRAGRIMDLLENKGVVGPSVGSKPREVHMTVEELEALIKRRDG